MSRSTWILAIAMTALSTVGLLLAFRVIPLGTEAEQPAAPAATTGASGVDARLASLEAEHDVRIGVAAIDDDGRRVGYRADERFGYASTLKTFAAAALLVEKSEQERGVLLTWTQADLDAAGYSPVTTQHLADGLTLDQLAEAAVRDSDNTAMNLVMNVVGGPAGVEEFMRGLGDDATDVSGYEPDLNAVVPGRDDNTTTPESLTTALREVLAGDALRPTEQRTLLDWMSGNATGDTLIRAGAPVGWTVADKSGGAGGIRNDIAVVTRPDGSRIHLSILTATNDPKVEYDDAVVERAARAVLAEYA